MMIIHDHPHDEEGGEGPIPWNLKDVLSGTYFAISIIIILVALISFVLSLKWQIDALDAAEQEHPTRHELATVAVKVDDKISALERHLEDLDIHGTRALADRTTLLEQANRSQAEQVQELTRRMNDLQTNFNKLQSDLPVIADRQNNNTNSIKELQQRFWSSVGERGPTAPSAYPPH